MNILALDTCTEMCSVALLSQGKTYEQSVITQRGHSEKILGMLDTILKEADCLLRDIDFIAFGRGPGSFTGVRVCVGVAQGIAFANKTPVIPISTLAAVAQRGIDEYGASIMAVAMDARMKEAYCGVYKNHNGLAQLDGSEKVSSPEAFTLDDKQQYQALGTAWHEYTNEFKKHLAVDLVDSAIHLLPTAAAMLKLAIPMAEAKQAIPADQAVPVYLRDNVAKKKGEQQRA